MVSPYLERECRTLAEAQASKTSSPQPEPINARLLAAARKIVNDWHADDTNFERELDGTPAWLALARSIIAEAEAQAKPEQAPASEAPINARLLAAAKLTAQWFADADPGTDEHFIRNKAREAIAEAEAQPQPEPINARLLAAAKSALPFVFRELNNAQDDMPTYTALETAIAEAEAQAKPEQAPASEAPINARLLAMLQAFASIGEDQINAMDLSFARDHHRTIRALAQSAIAEAESEANMKAGRPTYDELAVSLSFLTRAAETEPGMAIYRAHIDQARALLRRAGRE